MKVPIPITCPACGEKFSLDVTGGNLPKYSACPKCGAQPYNMWPLGNVVTKLLMERAKQELANGDITLSILLSAVAVEGEMAYLFFKWKGIGSGKVLADQTADDRKQWEDEWLNMRSIGKRLHELSQFLANKPFGEFAQMHKSILQPALAGYDSGGSIMDFFKEKLFGRRNDIAHYGKIDFQEADGKQSLSLATALLNLLNAMDMKRYDLTFPKT